MPEKIQFKNQEIKTMLAFLFNQPPSKDKKIEQTEAQLQQKNTKILSVLKNLQKRIDQELDLKKKNAIVKVIDPKHQNNSHHKLQSDGETNKYQVIEESIKNNQNYLKVLQHEQKKLKERNAQLADGKQSEVLVLKQQLENKMQTLKSEIKRLKLEEADLNKRLQSIGDGSSPQNLQENMRLEAELKSYSIKYVKLLEKHNKVVEKLAISENTNTLEQQIHIPEQLYDKELQQKEEEQFKEYQNIVKLCTILSKRNDSQHNKAFRNYSEKLKELQKLIMGLAEIDRLIALRQGEAINSKKSIEMIKIKISNHESIDFNSISMHGEPFLGKQKSYSTSKLMTDHQKIRNKDEGFFLQYGKLLPRKLTKWQ